MTVQLEDLNPEQKSAVTLPAAHAMIIAGAGSGKTRVLTTRIAWLVSTGQVGLQNFLTVTFTNKAARELKQRLAGMLPANINTMWIGTFHGLCNRFLRIHFHDAGLPQHFQIMDMGDQLAAIKRLCAALKIDIERYPPKELQNFINAQKEQGLRAHQVEAHDGHSRRRVDFFFAYDEQCNKEGTIDFPELLLRCYELMTRNETLLRHYRMRFQHILIDEFQDTNRLQYRWLKLLARAPTNFAHTTEQEGAYLYCVGDDDQSIYSFRGATISNMLDFERDFKIEHVIRLEQNYRSQGNILDAANAIISNNTGRLGKKLWTDAGAGEAIRIYEASDDAEEASWIVSEASSLRHDGVPARQIALLYRSNAQSRILEHALFSAGVPYRVFGGHRFFERQEIKHALAYLRLIVNPNDDSAFMRVVNFPTRGIGARSLEALRDRAQEKNCSLFAAIPSIAGRGGGSLMSFGELVHELASLRLLPLPKLVAEAIIRSGLQAHYLTAKEGKERLENLHELTNAATLFDSDRQPAFESNTTIEDTVPTPTVTNKAIQPQVPIQDNYDLFENYDSAAIDVENFAKTENGTPLSDSLNEFLSHAALEGGDHQASENEDALQLMTVHSAKGLEFDIVFLSGLEDELFPHEQSFGERDGLEEERRLMYVAITRARKRLYLSLAQLRMLNGQARSRRASRFLDEIPENLVKHLRRQRTQSSSIFTRENGASYYDQVSRTSRYPAGSSYDTQNLSTRAHPRSNARPYSSDTVPQRQNAILSKNGVTLQIGQSVAHERFGVGTIIRAEGQGQDARIQIHFRDSGAKWLSLAIAKLQAL